MDDLGHLSHAPSPPPQGEMAGGVLIFLKGFGPGGVERIGLRLAKGLRSAGAEVTLLLASDSGPMRQPGDDSRYHLCPSNKMLTAWPMIRLALTLPGMIGRRRPDILFCPGNAYMGVAAFIRVMFRRRCPPILAKVSNDLERRDLHRVLRPFYRLWLRLLGRMIDHFAVLSEPMAREASALLGVPRARVHILPNPVVSLDDIGSTARTSPIGKARRFIAVGRLERQKDYPLMLRAFAAARQPGDTLTLCGEGREAATLARMAQTLGIAAHVHFTGHCTSVPARMAEHDILLLTSLYEGQPGAIIEALSIGLNIVATRCCAGMDELLNHGALGTLIDRGDEAALIRAIARARPGSPDRVRAAEKARCFTIEAAVPAYARLFASIHAEGAQSRNPPPPRTVMVPTEGTGHA